MGQLKKMPMPRYSWKKEFKLSDEDKARYKEINQAVVAKGKEIDARAAADRMEAAAKTEQKAYDPKDDNIEESDPEFGGIVLFSDMIVGGSLDVTTDDVYVEEPRIIADDEDDENE